MAGASALGFNGGKIPRAAADTYTSSSGDESASDDDYYRLPDTVVVHDTDNTFRWHTRKRKRNVNGGKERAALGIFASDSEDDGPRKRWKQKTLRSKGVSFVSHGPEKPPDTEPHESPKIDDAHEQDCDRVQVSDGIKDEEDEDESAESPAFGLGASSNVGMGMGVAAGLGLGFVPSSSMQPALKDDSKPGSSPPRKIGPSAFGNKGKLSFAQRQMMKMGWKEGEGLGKDNQGRNTAIEANLRPMGLGLGAVKEKSEQDRKEEKRQAAIRGEKVIDSDEERRKAKKERKKVGLGSSALDSGASTPRRQKCKFLTREEMERSGMKVPKAFQQILDMTGREQRTLTAESGLMTPNRKESQGLDAEAVERQKIEDRARIELNAYYQEHQSLEMRKRFLDLRISEDECALEETKAKLGTYTEFQQVADDLAEVATDTSRTPSLKWQEATVKLTFFKESPHQEEVAEVAVSILHSIMREYVRDWDVLQEPLRFVKELVEVQNLLEVTHRGASEIQNYRNGNPSHVGGGIHRTRKSTTLYETMISQIWYPRVLAALTSWDAHNPGPILQLFQAWKSVLPPFILSQLMDQIVRKLDGEVQCWKPRKHKNQDLPHHWLFDWLPHLPAQHLDPTSKTGLVTDVKRKWRSVIEHWNLREGVIPGLLDWKPILCPSQGVLGKKDSPRKKDGWHPLILNHLLPRMASYLRRHFDVQPACQRRELYFLSDILKWEGIVSTQAIGELFEAEVFTKYHEVLYDWLLSDDPDYSELADWLSWWHTELFSPEIIRLPSVTAQLEKGLSLVNQALELGNTAKYHLAKPGSTVDGPEVGKKEPTPPARRDIEVEAMLSEKKRVTSFRDMVEEFCLNNDYQFIRLRNKVSADGHPMFRITARNDGKGGITGWFVDGVMMADIPGYTGSQVIDEKVYTAALHGFLDEE